MRAPAIDMRRVYLIARRDFLGYIKTWGFWISFFLPFVFGAFGFVLATLELDVEPSRYEIILDETGLHAAGIMDAFGVDEAVPNLPAAAAALSGSKPKGNRTFFIEPPADNFDALKPYMTGEKYLKVHGEDVKTSGVLHIYKDNDVLYVNYWSSNINSQGVKNAAKTYFRERSTRNYLSTGGLTLDGLRTAQEERVSIDSFDPTKQATEDSQSQAVTVTDKIPFMVAAVLAGILWLTVFSGSYMLLTSMLEEKLNKLLEMMLASTRFSEIIFGKLVGVAALTIAAMLPYILIGVGFVVWLLFNGDPEVAAGLTKAFTPKLVIFFIVFLALGYVFYGAFFIAVGALAESMQDAQTLTTPIMLLLTSCIMIVPIGLTTPDSPILTYASWFPLSAPFAAIVRLPSDPPWWELALSAGFLFVLSIGVVWIAGRVFQYGVLSGAGIKGAKSWIARVIFRRKSA